VLPTTFASSSFPAWIIAACLRRRGRVSPRLRPADPARKMGRGRRCAGQRARNQSRTRRATSCGRDRYVRFPKKRGIGERATPRTPPTIAANSGRVECSGAAGAPLRIAAGAAEGEMRRDVIRLGLPWPGIGFCTDQMMGSPRRAFGSLVRLVAHAGASAPGRAGGSSWSQAFGTASCSGVPSRMR
jgi:hypothetical protein